MTRPLALLLVVAPAVAAEPPLDSPFPVSNRNPFVRVQGLPPASAADLVSAGAWALELRTEVANSFTLRERNGEAIAIDGETWLGELAIQRGLADGLEVGVRIPWIRHDGGDLDGFIENWHDFWGLPDGDRDRFPRDRLDYRYTDSNGATYALPDEGGGLGDIDLTFGWASEGAAAAGWALRGGLSLPTGDPDRLTGSGGASAWGAFHRRTAAWGPGERFTTHYSAGLSYGETGDLLPAQRHRWIGLGSATVSWRARPGLALKAQLDAHTAPYESALKELGGSVQLVLGLSWRIGSSVALDLSLAEDIYVDTAPDVVFQAALRWWP